MTIHHDKLAYGRLAKTSEDMTDKQIEEMLKLLSEDKENAEKGNGKSEERDGEKE